MTITVTGLSATRSGRTILHPTQVKIRPGKRIGLVDESGCGKSTLGYALIVTHNLGYAAAFADEIAVLRAGRIEELTASKSFVEAPNL